jgi:hypothetical protein
MRWSTAAADAFADRCVDVGDTDSTTADTAASSSSGDDTIATASGSTTMEPPTPFCGDGIVDDDEECDPADVASEEPCNASCMVSGQLKEEFEWDHDGNDAALAVAIWDGDIAVAGFADWSGEGHGYDLHVARHAPNGALRWPPFRGSGEALKNDYARALAVTGEGTLRVVGSAVPEEGDVDREQAWLAEFDADGTLLGAELLGAPGITEQALSVVVIDETDFVVAGRAGVDNDFSIHRYSTASGKIAPVWEDFIAGLELELDIAYAVALRDDGFLFAGGFFYPTATDRDRYLGWWTVDGMRATAPCDGGDHPRPTDGVDEIRGVAFRPDGSVVAAGIGQQGATQDGWVGLYSLDTCELRWQSFEGDEEGADAFSAIAVDVQGNVITGGWLRDGTNDDTWLVAWGGDDELEILWQAKPENGPGDGDDRINAIAIDTDGTIVVAGQVSQPTDTDIWVARYTP